MEEIRRKNKDDAKDQSSRISGIKTFSTLMNEMKAKVRKDDGEAVFIEIAEVHPQDVFDIYTILRADVGDSSKNGHLILVSSGAKMVRLKKAGLFRRATFDTLEYIKTITAAEKYPTESELLERYQVTHGWQEYKKKTLSKALPKKCPTTADLQPNSELDQIHMERRYRNTKLLKTLKYNERAESNESEAEEAEYHRPPFQFELDRMQQDKSERRQSTDINCCEESLPSSLFRKRKASAVGALPDLIEHMILDSKSTPLPSP